MNRLLFVLSLLFLGVAASSQEPLRDMDDFGSSCDLKSLQVSGGRYATARCRTLKGDLRCSRLDLSVCVRNNYGSLQSDPTGAGPSYFDECYDCSNGAATGGSLGPTLLRCRCDPKTGAARSSWPVAVMDMNVLIDNMDGIMRCHGKSGTAYNAC